MRSALIAFAPDGDFGNGVFEGLIGGHEALGCGEGFCDHARKMAGRQGVVVRAFYGGKR